MTLKAHEYLILLKGVEVARYELPAGCELAIPVGKVDTPPAGRQTRDPAFGMTGWWVPADQSERARRNGFTVVDSVSVLGTHLAEVIRRHAHELLSRQDAKKILDRVAAEHPKAVEDLVPKLLPLAAVQRVLQNLLRERVSIRDSVTILEALGEAAPTTRNPILLTEYVRQSMRRQVVKPYLNSNGELPAYLLDATLEQSVESAVEHGEQNSHLTLSPTAIRDVLRRINLKAGNPETPVAVIASSASRYFFRQIVEPTMRNICFLSHNEIPVETKVLSLGVIQ
jgi:flagellar biosynthesis protein FlhA